MRQKPDVTLLLQFHRACPHKGGIFHSLNAKPWVEHWPWGNYSPRIREISTNRKLSENKYHKDVFGPHSERKLHIGVRCEQIIIIWWYTCAHITHHSPLTKILQCCQTEHSTHMTFAQDLHVSHNICRKLIMYSSGFQTDTMYM